MFINARTTHKEETIHPLPKEQANFVFIGYDSREDIAYRVCENSLARHSSRPLTIIDLNVNHLEEVVVILLGSGEKITGDKNMMC